ncbi:MAG: VWA domain-containing protein [Actinobacteria bacterium]|nr:VWA domain-containing protein [Actinomycetota bacterium]
MSVDERLLAFISELRTGGIQISLAESKDALEALKVIALENPGTLRSTLRATLVKKESDYPLFDAVFDEYFTGALSVPGVGIETGGQAALEEGDYALLGPADFAAMLREAVASGTHDDMVALALVAAEGIGMMEGGFGQSSRAVAAMAGSGYYVFRAMEWLDFRDTANRLEELARRGELIPDMPPVLALDRVNERIQEFRVALEKEIRRRIAAARGERESERKKRIPPRPEEVDFTGASLAQVEDMRRVLPALARRLAARLARKHSLGRRGRVDFRSTMRHSLSYGGVPLDVKYKKKVPSKPELFILCDISGSVRTFSTFTLQLVYSLHQQFRSVRSFAFIDRVDEVTDYFNSYEVDEAIEQVYREALVVDGDGHSDVGRALELFYQEFHEELSPKSSVLILSDARNNNRDPRAWALESLREKVKRVYWLNPEHKERWDTGDSIINEYTDHCYSVHECRNLKQLSEFVYRGA